MNNKVLAIAVASALMFGAGPATAWDVLGLGKRAQEIDNRNHNFNKNTNNNKNHNKNSNSNKNHNKNNNSNKNTSISKSKNTNTNNNNSKADVKIEGDDFPASSAAPVQLTTSNDTCMGSSGVGGQGMSFGFSIGSTWTDSNCIMLKNARELKMQGHDKAAKARLCMDEDNAMAFELAGEPCPRELRSTQGAIASLNERRAEYRAALAAASKWQTASTAPVAVSRSAAEESDSAGIPFMPYIEERQPTDTDDE